MKPLVAVAEKLLEEPWVQAEVGRFAHAEFERRSRRFAGFGTEGFEYLGHVPFADVDFVHGNAEPADASAHLDPDHRPDPSMAAAIHVWRELGPAYEGQNVAGCRSRSYGAHVSEVRSPNLE